MALHRALVLQQGNQKQFADADRLLVGTGILGGGFAAGSVDFGGSDVVVTAPGAGDVVVTAGGQMDLTASGSDLNLVAANNLTGSGEFVSFVANQDLVLNANGIIAIGSNPATNTVSVTGGDVSIISSVSTIALNSTTDIDLIAAGNLVVIATNVLVQCVGLGFFGAPAVAKQVSGADLTNNVAAGGVNDTIANFTDLTVYANDAATIRNDIYQLARKLKQINDGLRAYGLFT